MDRREPLPTGPERRMLEQFLDYQRATVVTKTEGVGLTGFRQRLPTSTLTIAGLVKHLALVEEDWIQVRFLGRPEREPWAGAPWDEDRDWEFHTAIDEDPAALRTLYLDAVERNRAAITGTDLEDLSAAHDREGRHWTLRWILLHLIEETARHAGHLDLLREAADGATGE